MSQSHRKDRAIAGTENLDDLAQRAVAESSILIQVAAEAQPHARSDDHGMAAVVRITCEGVRCGTNVFFRAVTQLKQEFVVYFHGSLIQACQPRHRRAIRLDLDAASNSRPQVSSEMTVTEEFNDFPLCWL